MALSTGHSQVCAGQREARFSVARQREVCRPKFRDAVALFTAILIRRRGELLLVHVHMATAALRLGNPKHRVLTLGDMALVAFHFGMPALDRVHTRCMFLDSKR